MSIINETDQKTQAQAQVTVPPLPNKPFTQSTQNVPQAVSGTSDALIQGMSPNKLGLGDTSSIPDPTSPQVPIPQPEGVSPDNVPVPVTGAGQGNYQSRFDTPLYYGNPEGQGDRALESIYKSLQSLQQPSSQSATPTLDRALKEGLNPLLKDSPFNSLQPAFKKQLGRQMTQTWWDKLFNPAQGLSEPLPGFTEGPFGVVVPNRGLFGNMLYYLGQTLNGPLSLAVDQQRQLFGVSSGVINTWQGKESENIFERYLSGYSDAMKYTANPGMSNMGMQLRPGTYNPLEYFTSNALGLNTAFMGAVDDNNFNPLSDSPIWAITKDDLERARPAEVLKKDERRFRSLGGLIDPVTSQLPNNPLLIGSRALAATGGFVADRLDEFLNNPQVGFKVLGQTAAQVFLDPLGNPFFDIPQTVTKTTPNWAFKAYDTPQILSVPEATGKYRQAATEFINPFAPIQIQPTPTGQYRQARPWFTDPFDIPISRVEVDPDAVRLADDYLYNAWVRGEIGDYELRPETLRKFIGRYDSSATPKPGNISPSAPGAGASSNTAETGVSLPPPPKQEYSDYYVPPREPEIDASSLGLEGVYQLWKDGRIELKKIEGAVRAKLARTYPDVKQAILGDSINASTSVERLTQMTAPDGVGNISVTTADDALEMFYQDWLSGRYSVRDMTPDMIRRLSQKFPQFNDTALVTVSDDVLKAPVMSVTPDLPLPVTPRSIVNDLLEDKPVTGMVSQYSNGYIDADQQWQLLRQNFGITDDIPVPTVKDVSDALLRKGKTVDEQLTIFNEFERLARQSQLPETVPPMTPTAIDPVAQIVNQSAKVTSYERVIQKAQDAVQKLSVPWQETAKYRELVAFGQALPNASSILPDISLKGASPAQYVAALAEAFDNFVEVAGTTSKVVTKKQIELIARAISEMSGVPVPKSRALKGEWVSWLQENAWTIREKLGATEMPGTVVHVPTRVDVSELPDVLPSQYRNDFGAEGVYATNDAIRAEQYAQSIIKNPEDIPYGQPRIITLTLDDNARTILARDFEKGVRDADVVILPNGEVVILNKGVIRSQEVRLLDELDNPVQMVSQEYNAALAAGLDHTEPGRLLAKQVTDNVIDDFTKASQDLATQTRNTWDELDNSVTKADDDMRMSLDEWEQQLRRDYEEIDNLPDVDVCIDGVSSSTYQPIGDALSQPVYGRLSDAEFNAVTPPKRVDNFDNIEVVDAGDTGWKAASTDAPVPTQTPVPSQPGKSLDQAMSEAKDAGYVITPRDNGRGYIINDRNARKTTRSNKPLEEVLSDLGFSVSKATGDTPVRPVTPTKKTVGDERVGQIAPIEAPKLTKTAEQARTEAEAAGYQIYRASGKWKVSFPEGGRQYSYGGSLSDVMKKIGFLTEEQNAAIRANDKRHHLHKTTIDQIRKATEDRLTELFAGKDTKNMTLDEFSAVMKQAESEGYRDAWGFYEKFRNLD